MAKKSNTEKFPKEAKNDAVVGLVAKDAEEAVSRARAEARGANVSGSSIIVTFPEGYANGDGAVFAANGVTAGKPKRDGKPIGD